jgi:hypothetical protein
MKAYRPNTIVIRKTDLKVCLSVSKLKIPVTIQNNLRWQHQLQHFVLFILYLLPSLWSRMLYTGFTTISCFCRSLAWFQTPFLHFSESLSYTWLIRSRSEGHDLSKDYTRTHMKYILCYKYYITIQDTNSYQVLWYRRLDLDMYEQLPQDWWNFCSQGIMSGMLEFILLAKVEAVMMISIFSKQLCNYIFIIIIHCITENISRLPVNTHKIMYITVHIKVTKISIS